MATLTEPDRPRFSTLFYFVVLSLLLHLALLLWLRGAKLSLGEFEPPPLVVKLAPAPPPEPAQARTAAAAKAQAKAQAQARAAAPPPQQQIVAPSDQENQLPPDGRAFLSDRDNRVDKESIKKGNPEAGSPQKEQPPPQPPQQVASAPQPPPPPAPKPPAPAEPAAKAPPANPPAAKAPPRPQAKAPPAKAAPKPVPRTGEQPQERTRGETIPERLPGLNQLFAPPAEVLAKAAREQQQQQQAGANSARGAADDPRKDLVSAPPPAPGLFGGARGSFDYLPDVAQGNLTMLNTKADRFAPFVRRVGTRVFQNLLIFQRQNLEASDIIAANDIVTARVILDASGKLKNLEVDDHSGSMAVDQTLIDAIRQAAFDDNPPKSAANDKGEYEFVFQAQLIAGVGPGPKGPALQSVESRLRIGLL